MIVMIYVIWQGSVIKQKLNDAECLTNITNIGYLEEFTHTSCKIVGSYFF